MEDVIKALADKAKTTALSHEALQFSQAACNIANTMRVMADTQETLEKLSNTPLRT